MKVSASVFPVDHGKRLCVSVLFILLHFTALSQDKVVKWINENAVAIETVSAESGFEDLMPLKDILKDKRIVAMGEATHGTKEFFQMKHRMMEFLAEEMGFTLFGIEANFSECFAINDYILHGTGDPLKALKGIYFWTWQTNEVLEMIEWMKRFNQTRPEDKKIRFYGFDMQFSKGAAQHIIKFLESADYALLQQYSCSLDILAKENPLYFHQLSEVEKNEVRENITALGAQLNEAYGANVSNKQYKLLSMHLATLLQFLDASTGGRDNERTRDYYMAKNVQQIVDFEGNESKIMLWAHNGHVQKINSEREQAMGSYLQKIYGKEYYAVGFDFNKGNFQAVYKGIDEFTVGEAKKNSSGFIFSKSNKAKFFLDFETAKQDQAVHNILSKKINSRHVGATFYPTGDKDFYTKNKLELLYDALIFINETSRAVPIPQKQLPAGTIAKSLYVKKYQGDTYELSIKVKAPPTVNGELRVHVIDNKGSIISSRIVLTDRGTNDWSEYRLTELIGAKATRIDLWYKAEGEGELLLKDIKFLVKSGDSVKEIKDINSTFEKDELNAKPSGWRVYAGKSKIVVTQQDESATGKCLMFKL